MKTGPFVPWTEHWPQPVRGTVIVKMTLFRTSGLEPAAADGLLSIGYCHDLLPAVRVGPPVLFWQGN